MTYAPDMRSRTTPAGSRYRPMLRTSVSELPNSATAIATCDTQPRQSSDDEATRGSQQQPGHAEERDEARRYRHAYRDGPRELPRGPTAGSRFRTSEIQVRRLRARSGMGSAWPPCQLRTRTQSVARRQRVAQVVRSSRK